MYCEIFFCLIILTNFVALEMIILTVLKLKNNSHVYIYTNKIEYQALVLRICRYED